MPNWCSTTFTFHGNKEEITTLHDKIEQWLCTKYTDTDFGNCWLGNILYGAGLQDRIDNPDSSKILRCRGMITDYSDPTCYDNDYQLNVWTETAWAPMGKMWNEVINVLELKTVGFSFMAEECGCELYWIYDPENYGDYDNEEVYLDTWSDNDDSFCSLSGYYTEEAALELLRRELSPNINNYEQACQICENYNDDEHHVALHRFEYIDELTD